MLFSTRAYAASTIAALPCRVMGPASALPQGMAAGEAGAGELAVLTQHCQWADIEPQDSPGTLLHG